MAGALSDLRIIELGHVIAGPLAATLLSDFGAEVIKVEHPHIGDMMRELGPKARDGVGVWFKSVGRNKKMLALNWKTGEGRKILRKLVESADVLVENFRPGVLERAGVGPEVLHSWNADLIILRISGYGQDGPLAGVPAFGRAAEAMAGLPHLTGFADAAPMHPGFPTADSITGLMGALGIMIAVHSLRNGDSKGQIVDLAVFEGLLRLIDYHVPAVTGAGRSPRRNGLRQPMDFVPGGMFQTSDGIWVTISAGSVETARRLLRAVGGNALADDPRFATLDGIAGSMPELFQKIHDFVAARDFEEVERVFRLHDAVAARVLSVEEIAVHPQILHRGDIVAIEGEDTRVVGPVPRLTATPGKVNWLGRASGADTRTVMREMGLSDDDVESLVSAGVIALANEKESEQ